MAVAEASDRLHRVFNSKVVDALQVLHNEVKCILCCDYFQDPYQCLNGHTYCKACIEHAMRVQSVCPECRNPIGRRDIKPNRKIGTISEGAHTILLDTFLEDVRWLVRQVGECSAQRLDTISAALTGTAGPAVTCSAATAEPTTAERPAAAKARAQPCDDDDEDDAPESPQSASPAGRRSRRARAAANKSAVLGRTRRGRSNTDHNGSNTQTVEGEGEGEDSGENIAVVTRQTRAQAAAGRAVSTQRPAKRNADAVPAHTPAKDSAAKASPDPSAEPNKRSKLLPSAESVPALDLRRSSMRELARSAITTSAPGLALSSAGLAATQLASPRQSLSSTGSPASTGRHGAAMAGGGRVLVIASTQLSLRGQRALEQLQALAPSLGVVIQQPLCLFDMRHGALVSRPGSPSGSPVPASSSRPEPLPVPRLTHVVVGPAGLGASQRRVASSPMTHASISSSSSSSSSSSAAAAAGACAGGATPGSATAGEVGLWATRRTPKYLCGLAQGAWIVSEQWLFDCLRVKALVHERPFELMGDAKAARAPRANRERVHSALVRLQPPSLFPQCIIVPPPVTRKAEKHVFFLARAAGCAHVAQVHELPSALRRAATEGLRLRIIVPGSAGGDAPFAQAAVIAAKALGVEDADVVGTHWLYESLSASKELPTLAFSELSQSPEAQWLRSTPDAADGKACGSVGGKHVGHAQWFLETQLRAAQARMHAEQGARRAVQERGDTSPRSPSAVTRQLPLDWEEALAGALPSAIARMQTMIRRRTKETNSVLYTW